jgi:cell division protein FtsL
VAGSYAVRRPVENAYLVRERDRRRLHELGRVLLVLVPVGAALLGYTWIQLEVLRLGYRIESLERELHGLSRRERQLQLEASYLASPQRVERLARENLDMEPPRVEQMIFVEEPR